jgi:hypothetical protein
MLFHSDCGAGHTIKQFLPRLHVDLGLLAITGRLTREALTKSGEPKSSLRSFVRQAADKA